MVQRAERINRKPEPIPESPSKSARSVSGRSARTVSSRTVDPEEEADPTVAVENPEGDLTFDFSKPGDPAVTAGRVLKKKSGETVFDFSDPAQPDLLTGEDPGVEETKNGGY